ncbi:MAG TPA: porin family protein [Steroidobacteraceae bacterium]
MRKSLLGLVAASLAMCPLLAAQAEDISYTYVDLGYVTTDLDGVGKDLDGFVLRGSFEVADDWFLYARYLDQSVKFSGVDFDFQQYSVGGGYAWSFADNMDLYGRLGYTEAELEVSGGGFGQSSVDDDGYELGVGIRARPVDALELEGAINYVDLSDSGDDTSFGVAARWFITDVFALGVEGDFADDADTYGIGFRLHFGN